MRLSDVTLREGDQLPGREFTAEQKVECARALDGLGLDFLQPGFPATGEKDQQVLSELAGTTDADVVGLARALEEDVDAVVDTEVEVVELFVSVSERHLDHLLGMAREEMLDMLASAVDYAHDRGATVHVTLADAFRTEQAHVLEVAETIADVPSLTLADTVGARTPASVRDYLDVLSTDLDLGGVGVHFHDDLGCATANALAAYEAGVGKVDVSVAGLGERAGNSPLEEVVVACAVDHDDDLGVETADLVPTCRTVLETLGESWDDRKAVLGRTVGEHESSIHTTAMLTDPATMEPYAPDRFGGERHLVFGAGTGESGARKLLERAGVSTSEERVTAYREALADRGPLGLDGALALATERFGEE
ncbi:LeuA family protein [Halomarina oriensis]|uniref:Citramalate synthase n=1 Tax=Halomarina oriensis TaxID=671145 RepID=A0A6B0GNN1_9EURY|nr:citramalate synthase [Halomarina oriensis]MWG36290.1 citramalate synthase [Halomarina oriensis]